MMLRSGWCMLVVLVAGIFWSPPICRAAEAAGSAVWDLSAAARTLQKEEFRQVYSLNGEWEVLPLGKEKDFAQDLFSYPVPEGKWRKAKVPVEKYPVDGWSGPEHAAWYRAQFQAPAVGSGRVLLRFEEVSFYSAVYLNGREIGKHYGGYIPLKYDVTSQLKPGQPNVLEVFTGDFTWALEKKAYPEGAPKNAGFNTLRADSLSALVYGAHKGILQDVTLEYLPAVRVADVFVTTSVRKHTMEAEAEIANASGQPQTLTVRQTVMEGQQAVLQLPEKSVTIPAGNTSRVRTNAEWKTPKLWAVKQPHLYALKTELLVNGAPVDVISTRFGFREFWIDKADFYLNGVKIKLRECATHIYYHPGRLDEKWDARYVGKPYEGAKAELESIQWANFNCTRMVHRPHPKYFYDIADELGHLVIAHFPVAFYKNQFLFSDPRLKKNAEDTVAGLIRKERNHPSIVIWEGENEGFPYGENPLAEEFARFYGESIGKLACSLDPTREVKYGRETDLFGQAAICDLHGGDNPETPELPLPNSNWLVPGIDLPYSSYGARGGSMWRWKRDKPLYFGEGLYWMGGNDKALAARYLGEKVFDDPKQGHPVDYQWVKGQEQYLEYGELEYFKIGLPVWRMLDGPAGYCPWGVTPGFGVTLTMRDRPVIQGVRELMKPERFFPKQLYRNFYGAAAARIDFCLLNDDYSPHQYTFSWQLKKGGEVIAGKSEQVTIHPAEKHWSPVGFTVPEVAQRTDLELNVRLERDGAVQHEERYPLRAYPALKPLSQKLPTVALYDPAGATAQVLKQLGLSFGAVKTLEEAVAGNPGIIILGEDSLAEGTPVPLALDEFVRRGGRVLALPQKVGKVYSPLVRMENERALTREKVFACSAGHPLLQQIAPEELEFWNHPDWARAHSVAVKARQKFIRGGIHPILECDSLWFSPLQEGVYGKGLYIECSLDIVRKLSSEPAARQFWVNILQRLTQFRPTPIKTVAVLRDQSATTRLQGQGIVCETVPAVPEQGILLVTAGSKVTPEEHAALRKFAESGQTLWLHCRKAAGTALAAQLGGQPVKTQPVPGDPYSRLVRRTPAGREAGQPLNGISSVVLYEKDMVDEIWTIPDGGAWTELATSGAVLTAKIGAGSVVVERLNWDAPTGLQHQQWADHFLAAFAANLGGEVDIFRYKKRKVYLPDDFFQIDLASVCNRDFRDDAPGDGKGGWTDQGPDNDLRGMKSGLQSYHQVVFRIQDPAANGGKACLVLYAPKNSEGCPKSTAEIPVGKPAKSLFFLHTAAWYSPEKMADKAIVRYHITYADGSKETVNALGGKNIKDWWNPGNCEESLGVSLLLKSDTEADAMPRRRGLVLQEWKNPQPEKVIQSLRIESGETGAVPVVMAISGLK